MGVTSSFLAYLARYDRLHYVHDNSVLCVQHEGVSRAIVYRLGDTIYLSDLSPHQTITLWHVFVFFL